LERRAEDRVEEVRQIGETMERRTGDEEENVEAIEEAVM
jgi:hypothetical protein